LLTGIVNKTVVLGDIHGCLREFEELIDRLDLTPSDRVVCLGDFMDKGPFPAECVRLARECGFESVLANHEERHIRWHKHEEAFLATGKKNPMRPMLPEDAAANAALSPEDWVWLERLPTTIDLGDNWVAVHGGFLPHKTVGEHLPSEAIRMRWVRPKDDGSGWETRATDYSSAETIMASPEGASHWADVWPGPQNVVYGHEAFSLTRPKVTSRNGVQTWGIDTGAAHGGHLTALVLPTMELIQVKSKANYCQVLVPIPE
jgi:hypothetical protein